MSRDLNEPANLQLLALASPLQDDGCVIRVAEQATAALGELGFPVVVIREPEAVCSDLPLALLVVSGGTEHRALEVLQRDNEPAVLLAHGEHNSLAAAIHLLNARLGQTPSDAQAVQLGSKKRAGQAA
jgi:hypothetical protein